MGHMKRMSAKALPMKLVGVVFFSLVVAVETLGAGEATRGWQAEWKRTIEAAKQEGEVTIYYGAGRNLLFIEAGVFQKRYPEIKVVTVGGDQVHRILSERRAGKYLADVVLGGSSTPFDLYLAKALDPIKDALILPEVVDASKWWQGKHKYIDPEQRYIFSYIGHAESGTISYNSRLVKPNEVRSWWDFLDPKWKGRIAIRDIRTPGPGSLNMRIFYYHPELGPKFIYRLFNETDATLFRDTRQGVDWLAIGKFAICFYCPSLNVATAKDQGLPVEIFGAMKEAPGLTSSSGNIALVNRAPHPNAAKIFVNWLLSREGQLTVQREFSRGAMGMGSSNSRRMDIPKDMVPVSGRLREGKDYIDAETPERMSMEPVLKVVNDALANARK